MLRIGIRQGRPAGGSSPAPSPAAAPFAAGQRGTVRQLLYGPREQADSRWEAEADQVAMQAMHFDAASETGVRQQVGSFLGFDFSGVRIHRESAAVAAEGAHAVAAGADVYLAPGRFRPDLPLGRALLAHELTHVAQQEAAPRQGLSLEALRGERSSGRLAAHAATLSDPQGGLSPAPRGMRQRCAGCTSGCARAATLRERFRSNNSQLSAAELDKIERAGALAARDNDLLRDSFLQYYSSHEIRKATPAELAGWSAGTQAETKPDSDTVLRPSLLEASTSDELLASLLVHEYTHTRHHTNYMGSRDYEEGDSYGIECFFARRMGNTTRQREIYALVTLSPSRIAGPTMIAELQRRFRLSFAAMVGLYEVIDTGASARAGSPFVIPAPLTRDEARALATELVSRREENHSPRLAAIMTWVASHFADFPSPES